MVLGVPIFKHFIRFFVKVLIEMNVNISNELNLSDVYQSVNYTGSLPTKVYMNPLGVQGIIHFARNPM